MNYHSSTYNGKPLYARQHSDTPLMIMMCGLPGSGKSTYAQSVLVATPSIEKPVIHSSDALRKEMFGDEATQGDNQKLFRELHSRIKADLLSGKDVIYDATNIKKKERIEFLKQLSKINCFTICIVMVTELRLCKIRNEQRERKVPVEVILRMRNNWTPPHYSEGFNYINFVFQNSFSEQEKINTISNYFEIANTFDQKNIHHSLTLGAHSTKAAEYIQNHRPNNFNLLIAALLHDNGKLFTQTKTNSKGENDGNCHYYQHQCVGAYECLLYLHTTGFFTNEDMVYISNLIYYHMHPYLQWKSSERVKKKDKELLGARLFNDIMILHEADLYAH